MKRVSRFLTSLIPVLFLVPLFHLGFFSTWQDRLSDQLFSPRPGRDDIAIIAIDDRSIQAIGRFPWDRSVYAKLLTVLGDYPSTIGLDVAFPEASTKEDDARLADALMHSNRVILPIEAGKLGMTDGAIAAQNLLVPIPSFRTVTEQGLVNTTVDQDGIVRRIPIDIDTTTSDGVLIQSFSEKLVKAEWSIPTNRGSMRINFIGPSGSFRTHSFTDVLEKTVPPETFKDKIVLIGATALDLHDNQLTPTSNGTPISGVEIHANAVQTILDRTFLHEESSLQTIFAILAISTLLALALTVFGLLRGSVAAIMMFVGYILYAIWSFDHGIIIDIMYPPLSICFVYGVHLLASYLQERKQKRFIRTALAHYVSEPVMHSILKDPKKLSLGGERKEITVLFSDIAGFTTISEKLPPDQLSKLLNQYLTDMTHLVFSHHGVLDKYIGDAVMAFWGAPLADLDQAYHACQTALDMQQAIEKLRESWTTHGIPNFSVRIGINTGEMAVGNMGSDVRFDYTLLGDNVNLGSRLEGINKEYGTQIVISQSTFEKVKDRVVARRLDTVAVKGKARGVVIYELRGLGKANEGEREFLDEFEQARVLYQQGKFKLSENHFSHLSHSVHSDHAVRLYLSRCKDLIAHPPADWDGVFHAKSK